MQTSIVPDVETLVAVIPDGTRLAVFKDSSAAMAATRALIRRRARGLHLITVPTSAFQAELLIAAGCVETIETSGVSMGELGPAPAFTRAVKDGSLRVLDSTCPAIYAGLQAAEKGVPFMPLRGLIGSDILTVRPDYRVVDNPFRSEDPIVALPAIAPDVALFHAPQADRFGNVRIGRQKELKLLSHAARQTLVTVEEVVAGNLLEDEALAAGTVEALYIDAVAVAPAGAWPLALPGYYDDDREHLAEYCRMAASAQGAAAYIDRFVHTARSAAE